MPKPVPCFPKAQEFLRLLHARQIHNDQRKEVLRRHLLGLVQSRAESDVMFALRKGFPQSCPECSVLNQQCVHAYRSEDIYTPARILGGLQRVDNLRPLMVGAM